MQQYLQDKYQYLNEYYQSLKKKSEGSKKIYLKHIEWFIRYYENEYRVELLSLQDFDKILTEEIEDYLNSLDINNSTKTLRLTALKNFFNFLVDKDYIAENPCEGIKLDLADDAEQIRSQILTKEEMKSIFVNILNGLENNIASQRLWQYRDYCLVAFAGILGLKSKEIVDLNMKDVDLENRKIIVKGTKNRTVGYGENVEAFLELYLRVVKWKYKSKLSDASPLFISNRCERICARTISSIIEKNTQDINKTVSLEMLRQTCINNVYDITGDLKITADYFGFDNVSNIVRLIIPHVYDDEIIVNELDDIITLD